MNDNRCPFFDKKFSGIVDNGDGTSTVERVGRCRKAQLGCECNGVRSYCDYYADIRTEHNRIEDNAPVMHGVNIIIKYDVGNPIGDYTIGWKKQIGKNTYGDYIRVTDGRDIKDVMREYFPLMVEQIEQVIETVSEKGGGEV